MVKLPCSKVNSLKRFDDICDMGLKLLSIANAPKPGYDERQTTASNLIQTHWKIGMSSDGVLVAFEIDV